MLFTAWVRERLLAASVAVGLEVLGELPQVLPARPSGTCRFRMDLRPDEAAESLPITTALPAGKAPSDAGVALDEDDLDKVFECRKVVAVACVQR